MRLIWPKPEPREDVGGEAHVDDVEEVEELGAELEDGEVAGAAVADGGVFEEGEVEVVEGGAAEGVAAEGAEAAGVGAGAAGRLTGMEKKLALARPRPK